ncbi:MAG: tRNA (adenosine(37)-N6)-threonylcarbamoyltransferase complex dimerization subunit type 1 TsaB [Bacteroides sp.]|nr:tRNA (adenosine(37)-N6)-threonylcarbamoyltransferase complex dimerization subunit type 1 TsaB [Bacteroides sp.]MCM1550561.1 tRNA (adenosine(37)-N6)-threonylcarbamoyltransferase complex dimerization subunit type 1 TsaB [Clostridium sp.]
MKVLAMDSSGLVATAAIIEDDILRAEYTMNYKKTHSQTLLPMIDEIVKMTETDLNEIDAIAVAGGPGSFTGLRIGAATAKGLGLALEKPIVSVPTVVGLAYNYQTSNQFICPIMDARRNQVYTGIYSFEGMRLVTYKEQCAISIEELLEELKQKAAEQDRAKTIIFLGDGVPVHRDWLDEHLELPHMFAPAHLNGQRAGALGVCALEMAREGKLETPEEHRPDYLRLSQAERERAEREQK